jgi:rSAM/selenodomain-associated transferase 1
MQNHLVIFARAPRLGRVKSRLARDIGPLAALIFYRRNLEALLRRIAADRRWQCWVAVTPDADVHAWRSWPRAATLIGQGPGDLGARMGRAMRSLPPGPVVIVGADIPDIGADHIAAAFRALGRYQVVFGPAADGGYWLVGQRRRPWPTRRLQMFKNVRWSTPHALADTLKNIPDSDVAFLATLEDIDDSQAFAHLGDKRKMARWKNKQSQSK